MASEPTKSKPTVPEVCKRCRRHVADHVEKEWVETICGEITRCRGRRCPDDKGSFVIAEYRIRL